ncbi:hypothetical protein [Krasilnikovia sp. M28-CT-15]|uniref:hypothetical protein n=1 Tax=Krasilnikovia sp. M28-CT-15 TaxID=3373540 RepID=UPI003875CFB3
MTEDDDTATRAAQNRVKGNRSFGAAYHSVVIHGNGNAVGVPSALNLGEQDIAEEPEEQPSSSGISPWKWVVGGVLAIIALCSLLPDPPEPKASFPSENGTRPAGSSEAAVLAAALGGLRDCAKAPVLVPENCPQQVKDWGSSSATDVTWRIHGVPGDGAVVVYNGDEGRFHVLGTAVMTASFQTASGPDLRLRVIQYWARVEWIADKARLAELRNYDDTPRPSTEKHDPQVPEEHSRALVREAFEKCAKAKDPALPPECPETYSGATSGKVNWKLNGDPSLNTKPRFEPATGLIHVVGNYSLTASYSQLFFGPTSNSDSGKYDAILSVDDQKPRVVRINRA